MNVLVRKKIEIINNIDSKAFVFDNAYEASIFLWGRNTQDFTIMIGDKEIALDSTNNVNAITEKLNKELNPLKQ